MFKTIGLILSILCISAFSKTHAQTPSREAELRQALKGRPVSAKASTGKTHVFWYKAKTNQYALTDCHPGPCLPKDAIIHEGKIVTGSWGLHSIESHPNIRLGRWPSGERVSSYFWSQNLNAIQQGSVKSAKLRAEYIDGWRSGKRLCGKGELYIRCGVIDYQRNIDAYGGIKNIGDSAPWRDSLNLLRDSVGFNASTKKLKAEEIKKVVTLSGRKGRSGSSILDGKFFEIDITRQVNWILAHPGGQYGILFIVLEDKGNTGQVTLYTYEGGSYSVRHPAEKSWSNNANTCHVVAVENEADPLVLDAGDQIRQSGHKDGIVWKTPKPYSVITTDRIPLSLSVHGRSVLNNLKKVTFYASFFDKELMRHNDSLIGEMFLPPYRFIWNGLDLADMSIGKLRLSCDIARRDGNDTTISLSTFVLDRHPEFKADRLLSTKAEKPVILDGDMSEWPTQNGANFKNNDNRITFYSQWDETNLYFCVKVMDKNTISHFPPYSEHIYPLFNEDDIEIFLESDHMHKEIMGKKDNHFLFAAAGMMFEAIHEREIITTNLKPEGVRSRTSLSGINQRGLDVRKGYVLECAISFASIGFVPSPDTTLGLEVWNTDLDTIDISKEPYYASWTGNLLSNFHNPSEWGNLRLVDGPKKRHGSLIILATFGFLLVAFFILVYLRMKSKEAFSSQEKKNIPINKNELIVNTANKYIEENYKETIKLNELTRITGVSVATFARIYRKQMGITFSEFLMKLRVEKAKYLLANTQLTVTEIAMEVGYNSLENFDRAFSKLEKTNPQAFRKNKG